MKVVWVTVFAAALLGAAFQSTSQQDSTPASQAAPSITDGATLFQVRGCAQCHEMHGAGGHKGPDLSGVGRRLKPEAINKQIVSGGGAMPAFGEALPADEINALVAYLHRQRDKTPKL